MVRQDIVTGLKNAVERGYSLEQAAKVMLSSGYSLNDISEAVSYLTGGISQEFQNFLNYQRMQPIQSQSPARLPPQYPQKNMQKPIQQLKQIPQQLYSPSIPQPPRPYPPIKPTQPTQYIPPQPIQPVTYQQPVQYPVSYQTPQEALSQLQNMPVKYEEETEYIEPPKKGFPFAIVTLSVLLVILIVLLVLTIVFKDNVISFLQNFVGS